MNYMDMCITCTFYKGTNKNGVCRRFPPRTPVEADDQCGEYQPSRKTFSTTKRDTSAPGSALIDAMLELQDDNRADSIPYSD
jgi:hypothetical protein